MGIKSRIWESILSMHGLQKEAILYSVPLDVPRCAHVQELEGSPVDPCMQ